MHRAETYPPPVRKPSIAVEAEGATSDQVAAPPVRKGVIEQFSLKLGTEDEPKSLSNALRELRCHLDQAKIKTWAYADPMWTDESRSGVKVVFPDTRAAEIAVGSWLGVA